MCGICGIFGKVDVKRVEAMVSAMGHRGPDDRGFFLEPGIALGMARLAVIDLGPKAHQPMSNAKGTRWIVYNGETYNFREEREILIRKGHCFSSASDTEVILKMYEEYGDEFLPRVRGMFALAIYDKERGPGKERLLLARDPLGIKPLLYAKGRSTFLFASEIKAILASGLVERQFDPESLRLLMTHGSITQPRTAISGVKMLLPGHRLICEADEERIDRFWHLGVDRIPKLRSEAYEVQVESVRDTLQESIRLQMVSDVPIGAFLSGGVDSSLVVALMSRISGATVKTFSVGFETEGADIDETDDARRVARLLGTDHSRVIVRGEDFRDKVSHIAWALDQPSVDGVNSYFISMAARRSATVAVSGTGGDELFAGYPWFINMVAACHNTERAGLKGIIKAMVSRVSRHGAFNALMPTSYGEMLEQFRVLSGFRSQYARQYQIFGARGTQRILSRDLRQLARVGTDPSHDLAGSDELAFGSPVERVSSLCLRSYTQNQLLRDIDAVSMAHSLEVRVPYLDVRLVDVALSLPDATKLGTSQAVRPRPDGTYRETGAKRILIDAGRHLLPEGIDRQAKRGFGMPFDAWLRGPLREVLDDALSPASVRTRGFFDGHEVQSIKKRFIEGQVSWVFPWLLIVTELWCREVLERTTLDSVN